MLNEAEVKTNFIMAAKGHSKASIARVIACSRPLVDRYLAIGGSRPSAKLGLCGLVDWLQVRLLRHDDDADVVRQDLQAELGYSRRRFALVFARHQQAAWFEALEATYRHFDGIPNDALVDNGRALVKRARQSQRCFRFG